MSRKNDQNEKVKLSVIVPIYNAQNEIYNLLKDIREQSYDYFEVIMIDDGSKDNSGEICKKFTEMDKRFIYVYQSNKGVSSARNHGLRIAKGKYINFLDSDDRIPLERFEKMIQIMEQDERIDLVIGKYKIDLEEGEFPFSRWQSNLVGKQSIRTLVNDYAKSMSGFYYGVIWNKLYKKDIIMKYDLMYDETMSWGEDLVFNLQYFFHIQQCFYLTEYIYHYCYTAHSLLSDTTIYKDYIDFERYKRIMELGLKLKDKQEYLQYVKKADDFLMESIIRQLGMKVTGVKFYDNVRYQNFKDYILLPEVNSLFKKKDIFWENRMYRVIQKLIINRNYHLLFYLFVLKDRANKNWIWNWIKQVMIKRL